jgi:alpha/beta superfamily hydrolase
VAGFSFGAWVGLRVGCEDLRVAALVAMGTPVNNCDFSYLLGCQKPKLFVQGSRDEHGDIQKLEKLIATLPGENHLVVIEGAEHFFLGQLDRVDGALTDWLVRHITGLGRG